MEKLMAGLCGNRTEKKNKNNEKSTPADENPMRSALDELVRTEATWKKEIETKQETKRQWRVRETALRTSNWKLELELAKLRDQTENLDNSIIVKNEEGQKIHDDFERYKLRNKQEILEFWTYFQEEAQKYSNLIPNAHIEYSSDCLKQSIEQYRKEAQIVRDNIADIERVIEALKTRCGLAEFGTNPETNILVDFETLKKAASDKNLLREKKSAEDTNEVLKLKIKQKQQEISYLKNKSRKR